MPISSNRDEIVGTGPDNEAVDVAVARLGAVRVSDDEVSDLLYKILMELRKLVLMVSEIGDVDVPEDGEVDYDDN